VCVCIDRCVSEDFFIAFLTRLFSEIICNNYTRDTKIINYIGYSEMYIGIRYGNIIMMTECVCVCSLFFFFMFFYYRKHVSRIETDNRTLLNVYHYAARYIWIPRPTVTKLVRKTHNIYVCLRKNKYSLLIDLEATEPIRSKLCTHIPRDLGSVHPGSIFNF